MTLLSIHDATKIYGAGNNTVKALNHFNLDVNEHEFVAIMGPSGSGKSTLLNCLSTIDTLTEGTITINDININQLKGKKLNDFRNKQLGFIFQDFNLLDTLTNKENIALTLSIGNVSPKLIEQKVIKTSKLLGIESLLNKYPYQCSGGQKQRVACVRAMVNNPSLILADEPTGALDSENRNKLMECFVDMNQNHGVTLLMVTHDATSASFASKVCFIKDGQCVKTLHNTGNKQTFLHEIMQTSEQLGD